MKFYMNLIYYGFDNLKNSVSYILSFIQNKERYENEIFCYVLKEIRSKHAIRTFTICLQKYRKQEKNYN